MAADPALAEIPQFLPDQQVAILRARTSQGELLAALTGGHNGERHNHNDLGHFLLACDERWIVPDLGAPGYTADFFGPRRYTYLPASSRGHCCPLIGDFEQRPGVEAMGKIVFWTPEAANPQLVLDLTAAYPPEAGLLAWTRSLERRLPDGNAPARMVLADRFHTRQVGLAITHTLWSLVAPEEAQEGAPAGRLRLRLGPVCCELSPAPESLKAAMFTPEDLRLHAFAGQSLHRIEAVYRTDAEGRLTMETCFFRAALPNPGV